MKYEKIIIPEQNDLSEAVFLRKNKLPSCYDEHSYELGFHAAYHWFLSELMKKNKK